MEKYIQETYLEGINNKMSKKTKKVTKNNVSNFLYKDSDVEVSVIIPVYNAADTILNTLESIRKQDISNMEIICVNDGSSDNTLDVLNEQSDIVVKTIENQGPGNARNEGLKMARGRYITFCDADDIMLDGALNYMLALANCSMADIVVGRYKEQVDGLEEKTYNINFTATSEMVNFFAQISCYARLYSREFLLKNQIEFPKMSQGEDRLFLARCYKNSPKVYFTNTDVYLYKRYSGKASLMQDGSIKAFSERLACWDEYYEVCNSIDAGNASKMLNMALFFLAEQWYRISSDNRKEAFSILRKFFENKVCSSGEFKKYFKLSLEDFWNTNSFEEYAAKIVEDAMKSSSLQYKKIYPREKVNAPLISIIIPAYNTDMFISKCLLSVVTQDIEPVEIIVVNDCSTDSTGLLLDIFASYDKRIQHLMGTGNGAGAARNQALKVAKGKYVCFLDSDDYFERKMLSSAFVKCEKDNLDMCVWGGVELDNVSKKVNHNSTMLIKSMVPDAEVFAGTECQYLYNMTNGAPWNKLFRKSFFDNTKVSFMEQTCFNDLYAMFILLASAKRIGVIQEELLVYRVNNKSSLQGAKDKSIEDAFAAFKAVEDRLKADNLFNDTVRLSFSNYVLSCSIFILNTSKSYDSFCKTYDFIKGCDLIASLKPEDIFDYCKVKYDKYLEVMANDREEYIFNHNTIVKESSHVEVKNIYVKDKVDTDYMRYLKECEKSLIETRKSFTYKCGRALTYLPRLLRHILLKKAM